MDILIIEDDPIWLIKLQMMIEQLDLGAIRIAKSIYEAQQAISTQLPNLILADVVLPDGLSFELFVNDLKDLPVIFLTGYKEEVYLKKALIMPNSSFLVKPFHMMSLQAAIEVLVARLLDKPVPDERGIWVIGKYKQRIQIPFAEIYWIETKGNYSVIYTYNNRYALKRSLCKVAADLTNSFIQVQKSFIINSDHVQGISSQTVQLNQQQIPIGRKYRKKMFDVLKEKR